MTCQVGKSGQIHDPAMQPDSGSLIQRDAGQHIHGPVAATRTRRNPTRWHLGADHDHASDYDPVKTL